jgi:hypothetical protein
MKLRNWHCQMTTRQKLRAQLIALTIASLKVGCRVKSSLQGLRYPHYAPFTALQGTHGNLRRNQSYFDSDSFPIGDDNHASYCMVNSPHLLDDLVVSNKGTVDEINVSHPSRPRVPNYVIGGVEEKSEPRVLRVSTSLSNTPPTISYGVAIWNWKRNWEMDKETQRKSRQRMQKKHNAPCNNQLERTKRKEDKKEGNLPPRKLYPSLRTRSNRIPPLKKPLNPQCLSQ